MRGRYGQGWVGGAEIEDEFLGDCAVGFEDVGFQNAWEVLVSVDGEARFMGRWTGAYLSFHIWIAAESQHWRTMPQCRPPR